MSSRRVNGIHSNLYEVFDSRGIVFGTAVKSENGEFVYAQPLPLQGRPVQLPFYVSSHPRASSSHFKDVCMRALLTR